MRVVLSALAGATMVDLAIGPPPEDPEREAFRSYLKDADRKTPLEELLLVCAPGVRWHRDANPAIRQNRPSL